MKRFFYGLMDDGHDPYVTTLAWTGRIRTDTGTEVPAEEFLTGVVAAEIPAEYGIETLKAQAVLARTYIYRLVDPGLERIREEELDIDCLSMREMEKKWGKEHFREYYGKIRTAVQETEGLVAEYDGELIEPFTVKRRQEKRGNLPHIHISVRWRVREIWGRRIFMRPDLYGSGVCG